MNTAEPPTEQAPVTVPKRCRCCIALILALLILGPPAIYPPLRNFLHARRNVELVQQFNAPDADIPALLKEVAKLDGNSQEIVLDAARPEVIGYFKSQAQAAIDESKGRCDYDAALHTIYTASVYYPDSAELAAVANDIRARKALAAGKTDAGCQVKH